MKRFFFTLPDIHSFRAWTSLRILSNSRQNLPQSKQERKKIDKVSFFLYKTINKMFQSGLMTWHVLKSHKNIFVFRSLRVCDKLGNIFQTLKFLQKFRTYVFCLSSPKNVFIEPPENYDSKWCFILKPTGFIWKVKKFITKFLGKFIMKFIMKLCCLRSLNDENHFSFLWPRKSSNKSEDMSY